MAEGVGLSTSSAGCVEASSSSLDVPIVVSTGVSSTAGRMATDSDGELG